MVTRTPGNLKIFLVACLLPFAGLFSICETERAEAPAPLAAVGQSNAAAAGPNRPISALHNKTLADIRQATARYHSLDAALADGFQLGSNCVSSPLGGMGYHYVNFSRIFDGTIDPSQPEALVYEPMKNGKLRLVAVEYIVDAETWQAQHDAPPVLGDEEFDNYLSLEGNPLGFPHYQLHAWVWKHNPSGLHAAFNPTVSCAYGTE